MVDDLMFQIESASLVIMLLDARRTMTATEFGHISRLRARGMTLLIVLNHADAIPAKQLQDDVLHLETQLARKVYPICANDSTTVQNKFLPHLIKLCPDLADALASESSNIRQHVGRQIIRDGVMKSSFAPGSELIHSNHSPLTDTQIEMISRLAELYGLPGHQDDVVGELLPAVLDTLQDYAQALLNVDDAPMRNRSIAAALTWVVGRVAVIYYDAGLPSLWQWLRGEGKPSFYEPSNG
jgi:hypothetical protein